MSDLYKTVKAEFTTLRNGLKEAIADGKLSLKEFGGLVRDFLKGAHTILTTLNVEDEKRLAVLTEAVLEWWDEDLKELDLPGPDMILDPAIRAALPGVVRMLYSWLLAE